MNKKIAALLIALMLVTTYVTYKSLDKVELDVFEFEEYDDQDFDL